MIKLNIVFRDHETGEKKPGQEIYINPSHITHMTTYGEGRNQHTEVYFGTDGRCIYQSPEWIMKLISEQAT